MTQAAMPLPSSPSPLSPPSPLSDADLDARRSAREYQREVAYRALRRAGGLWRPLSDVVRIVYDGAERYGAYAGGWDIHGLIEDLQEDGVLVIRTSPFNGKLEFRVLPRNQYEELRRLVDTLFEGFEDEELRAALLRLAGTP